MLNNKNKIVRAGALALSLIFIPSTVFANSERVDWIMPGKDTASSQDNEKVASKSDKKKIVIEDNEGGLVRVLHTSDETAKEKKVATRKTAGKSRRSSYGTMIRAAAKKHGVPLRIAKAVVQVESNFNPRARGSAGEIGLMQIKPATARGLGFRGPARALYDPRTNLEWGMRYLAGAHARASGDLCGTILRYNAGHFAKRMNPVSRRYCRKVKRILASS